MALKPEQKNIVTVMLVLIIVAALLAVALLKSALVLPMAGLAVAASLTLGLLFARSSAANNDNAVTVPQSSPPMEKPNPGKIDPGQRVRATLSDRVVFERITAAILEDFVRCTAEEFQDNMSRVLSRLGSFAGASRCYLYRCDESKVFTELALSWSRPGASDIPAPRPRLDIGESGIGEWLKEDRSTLVGDLKENGDPSLNPWAGLVEDGVRALGAVPIRQQDKELGFLVFDSRNTQKWGSQESSLLLLVADLFVAIWSKFEAEQALHEAMENLQASNRAKTDFLANMSHEIRTPMNCILGISDLLIEMEPTERQLSYLSMIHDSGSSLLTLINEILDLSKIEAGQLVLDPMDTDLRKLAEETVSLIAFQAQSKGLEILCRMDPQIPEKVLLDPGRLRQILTNLLNNASKFTNQGYILLDIQSRSRNDELVELHFTIQDTGLGIPEDKLEMIFEKFTQAEVNTTRKFGGTGLGLSISQHLVGLMGGQITATSREGKGSTFSFTIPAPSSDAPPEYRQSDGNLGALVVTEFDLCGSVMTELFQTLKMPCRIVSTWDRAFELIVNQPADSPKKWSHVLLDSIVCSKKYPDISSRLADIPDHLRPRVLLMSSLADLHLDSDLNSCGFSGTLTKPVFIRKLAGALSERDIESERIPASPPGERMHTEPRTCLLSGLENPEDPPDFGGSSTFRRSLHTNPPRRGQRFQSTSSSRYVEAPGL